MDLVVSSLNHTICLYSSVIDVFNPLILHIIIIIIFLILSLLLQCTHATQVCHYAYIIIYKHGMDIMPDVCTKFCLLKFIMTIIIPVKIDYHDCFT